MHPYSLSHNVRSPATSPRSASAGSSESSQILQDVLPHAASNDMPHQQVRAEGSAGLIFDAQDPSTTGAWSVQPVVYSPVPSRGGMGIPTSTLAPPMSQTLATGDYNATDAYHGNAGLPMSQPIQAASSAVSHVFERIQSRRERSCDLWVVSGVDLTFFNKATSSYEQTDHQSSNTSHTATTGLATSVHRDLYFDGEEFPHCYLCSLTVPLSALDGRDFLLPLPFSGPPTRQRGRSVSGAGVRNPGGSHLPSYAAINLPTPATRPALNAASEPTVEGRNYFSASHPEMSQGRADVQASPDSAFAWQPVHAGPRAGPNHPALQSSVSRDYPRVIHGAAYYAAPGAAGPPMSPSPAPEAGDLPFSWFGSPPSSPEQHRPSTGAQRTQRGARSPPAGSPSERLKCPHCEQTFTRQWDLRRHHTSKHKFSQVQCEHCQKMFTRTDSMKRHQRDDGCAARTAEQPGPDSGPS